MNPEQYLGAIKIIDVVDNDNGTCSLTYEVPEQLKASIKRSMGWKRWSSKKFNDFFLEALTKYAKDMETEHNNNVARDQCLIDVFDIK
jgi:hypothetical protein